MTTEHIRRLYETQPFVPFTIHLADGRSISVPHGDFLALGPTGRTVIVYQPDESFNIVDLLLVTDLKVSSPQGKGGNGEEVPAGP
jgi:hypothetical protein